MSQSSEIPSEEVVSPPISSSNLNLPEVSLSNLQHQLTDEITTNNPSDVALTTSTCVEENKTLMTTSENSLL